LGRIQWKKEIRSAEGMWEFQDIFRWEESENRTAWEDIQWFKCAGGLA